MNWNFFKRLADVECKTQRNCEIFIQHSVEASSRVGRLIIVEQMLTMHIRRCVDLEARIAALEAAAAAKDAA